MKTNQDAPAFANATQNPNLIGLTKREYFAGFALQGLLAKGVSVPDAGAGAVRLADELIKRLNEENKK
jgi:hypothetical protein